MTKESYIRITEPFRSRPRLAAVVGRMNRVLTMSVYLIYPAVLVYLFLQRSPQLLRMILVPLDGFIAVSVFRWMINRKRPYETFALPPVIPKNTKGKSFPSRHVFSAFVIASSICFVNGLLWLGVILLVVSALIAGVRVAAGVHYPSDVIAGAVLGIGCALLGFAVI